MKTIKLTKNKFALVNDEDFNYLNQFKWFHNYSKTKTGYAMRVVYTGPKGNVRIKKKVIMMHNVVLERHGYDLTNRTSDHINRNGLDNRIENLRVATYQQNTRNRSLSIKNTSGFKGVYLVKNRNKWDSRIKVDGKVKFLGLFNNKIEAMLAYNQAAKQYFKEFAYFNQLKGGTNYF